MQVTVKFNTPMMKNGIQRNIGDEMTMDATSAILLAEKGSVEIVGYDIIKVKKEIEVSELVPKE